jgi:hypothetical protein
MPPEPVPVTVPPLSDVELALAAFPNSKSLLHAVKPLAHVLLTMLPTVGSLPLWFAVDEGAVVHSPTGEHYVALTVHLVVLKLPFVELAVTVDQNAPSVTLAVEHLTEVEAVLVCLDLHIGTQMQVVNVGP